MPPMFYCLKQNINLKFDTMILLAYTKISEPETIHFNNVTRTAFDRMVVKTRFEDYSEYLWTALNLLRRTSVHDIKTDLSFVTRYRIFQKRQIAESLLVSIESAIKLSQEIDIVNKKASYSEKRKLTLTSEDLLSGVFNFLKHKYATEVDPSFDIRFNPVNYDLAYLKYPNHDEKKASQEKTIESVRSTIERLETEYNETATKGAPPKNIWLHAAIIIMLSVCEPRYDSKKILDAIETVTSHCEVTPDMYRFFLMDGVVFPNDVELSNQDKRDAYDILRLFGFIDKDEECATRDNARFMKSALTEAKKIGALCFLGVRQPDDTSDIVQEMVELAEPYIGNEVTLQSSKRNSVTNKHH